MKKLFMALLLTLTLMSTVTVVAQALTTGTWASGGLAVSWSSERRAPDTWFLTGSWRSRARGTNSVTQARASSNGTWSSWANPNVWAQQDSANRLFGNTTGFDARRR